MIVNSLDLKASERLKCDICIVGSGAVAYAMANRFVGSKKKVVVLESSHTNLPLHGPNPKVWDTPRYEDPWVKELDNGFIHSSSFLEKARPDFFNKSRTRCLGGSTNCWGGWIRPLDEYDFNEWPIGRSSLDSYYRDALKLVNLKNFELFDQPNFWKDKVMPDNTGETIDVIPFTGAVKTVVIQQQTKTDVIDFQTKFKNLFTDNENLTLVRNATAVSFITYRIQKWHFQELKCRKLIGEGEVDPDPIYVDADNYILAMGGLEIPRFLLNNPQRGTPLEYLPIGKYYMNHPKYNTIARGYLYLDDGIITRGAARFYSAAVPLKDKSGGAVQAYVVPTKDGILNFGTKNFRIAFVPTKKSQAREYEVRIELNFEQTPNSSSQLILDESKPPDIFGQLPLLIDWKFSEQDSRTVNHASLMMEEALKRLGDPVFSPAKLNWDFKSP